MNTLPKPYYDKMIGNAMLNFVEMVWSDELIEHSIKNKKIEGKATPTPVKKATLTKRKKGDAYTSSPINKLGGKRHILVMPLTL